MRSGSKKKKRSKRKNGEIWVEAGDLPLGKVKVIAVTKEKKTIRVNGKIVKIKSGKKFLTTRHKGCKEAIKEIKEIKYLAPKNRGHRRSFGSGITITYPPKKKRKKR